MGRRVIRPEDLRALREVLGLDPDAALHIKERLRELRMEHGLTLDQLADICSLSGRGVTGAWEREEGQNPELSTMHVLADFYGTTLDYLVGRAGAERDSPALVAGKSAVLASIQGMDLQQMATPQRIARAWQVAQEVAPFAFPARRVAGLVGLAPEVFGAVIRGEVMPSPVVINRIAFALGLPEELLRKK